MTIHFVDFKREYLAIKDELNAAIERVLSSGFYILGPEVSAFEKAFAAKIGVQFAVGVASGTDALYLSLLASDVGQGDEVIIPVNTAVATATAVAMSGATPVFADCDGSFLIDIEKVPALITKKTKAIIPVHLYGKACDMDKLSVLAKEHRLTLIEDCAQATGAKWNGKQVGSFGDFGAFSFYPTKNLGAYGDGGAILVKKETQYKKLLALRFYGEADRVHAGVFGINSRLDELQAAILSTKLEHLDAWNVRRGEIAALYRKRITNPSIILSEDSKEGGHVYHLFVVRVRNRDSVREALKAQGIATGVHYPVLLHRQPFFSKWGSGSFPNAEESNGEILSLPLHPFLEDREVGTIAAALNSL